LKTKLLIDADIYAFRALATTEEETNWGNDVWTLSADHKQALTVFTNEMQKITEELNSDNLLLCFSGSDNFRKHINPTYKGNRKNTRKPLGYSTFVENLKAAYDWQMHDNLEADDVLGMLATRPDNTGDCVVVSEDKDLMTIPCKLYRPHADERMDISEQDADRHFFMQTLTGDPTDGYKGCPTIGAKRAEAILGSRPAWSLVEAAFIKQGLTREDALLQARMARILRWSDWDEKKREPILWEPSRGAA
jgi:DNA polymerase-1